MSDYSNDLGKLKFRRSIQDSKEIDREKFKFRKFYFLFVHNRNCLLLVLLERVLLKLGLSDTDEQLEMQLNKFLGPVLLKIVSPSEEVRKKVMEILTHVNKRLKSRAEVKLDLLPLLKHYQESSNSFLINFAIIYITLGFPRLDIDKQTELVPAILNALEGKPDIHQNKLLMLILPLLGNLKLPENPADRKTLFGLSERPNTKQHLLSILLDVLLLPYGHIETEVPPGMSSYTFKRVNLEDKKAEYLENVSCGWRRVSKKFLTFRISVEEGNREVPRLRRLRGERDCSASDCGQRRHQILSCNTGAQRTKQDLLVRFDLIF